MTEMRITEAPHHLKTKNASKYQGNQANEEGTTSFIVNKATATFRASLGMNDPHKIWAAMGLYIQKNLMQRQAVRIVDFGVFDFDKNNEPTFTQDPVFLRMTRLSSASRIRNDFQPVLSDDHVINVDVMAMADEYLRNCNKDLVKSVISSVMAWVTAWVKDSQELRLSFYPVGEWVCNGEKAGFRFLDSFCRELAPKGQEGRAVEFTSDNHHDGNGDYAEPLAYPSSECTVPDATSVSGRRALSRSSTSSASRYQLRAPTRSSIAKQQPPVRQRQSPAPTKKRFTTSTKAFSSGKQRVASNKRTRAQPQRRPPSAQTEAATNDMIPVTPEHGDESIPVDEADQSRDDTPSLSPIQAEAIECLRRRISSHHSEKGLNALVAVFNTVKTSYISPRELSAALRKLGVKVSSAEMKGIATACAHRRKQGCIDTGTLLDVLRGPPLSTGRWEMLAHVFQQMDPSHCGAVCINKMIKHYNVDFLPQVRDGTQTRIAALNAFLQDWASYANNDANVVTFEAFVVYYHNVSACITDDTEFAQLLHQTWQFDEDNQVLQALADEDNGQQMRRGTHQAHQAHQDYEEHPTMGAPPFTAQTGRSSCASESLSDTRAEVSDEVSSDEAWTYLRALLLFSRAEYDGINRIPTMDNMCRRLGANRILGDGHETMNVKAFAHALSVLDKRLRPKQIHDLTHFVATYCSEAVSCGEFISLVALYRTLVGTPDESIAAEPVSDSNTVDSYASKTIERIRARLFADSSDCESIGIVHPDNLHSLKPIFHKFLQKKSPWLSGSNDGSVLSKGELRACLQHIGVDVTYQELDYLFAYFDIDRDGFIDFDLFIDVLGDVSNPLPKLIQRPPSRRLSTKAEPKAADAAVQELPTLGRTSSLQTVGRKKQQATTRVQQPNYRRSNVIQRAIWDFSTRPRTGSLTEGLAGRDRSHEIDAERRYRYRAAQLIQSMFRGFRSRQIAMQLRRKVFAQRQRRIEESEPLNVKKRISRTVLGNAYGF